MKKQSFLLIPFITLLLIWSGCKKDEQIVTPPAPDNEVITTVKLIAINTADSTDLQTARWADVTSSGTPDLTQAFLNLKKNAVYNVSVQFLDETQTPAGDITDEVRDRGNYHLICYQPAAALRLTVQRTDIDNNSPAQEIGITSRFTTTDSSGGNLNVSLHHQPSGKNGDCAVGSTDADVNFEVRIR